MTISINPINRNIEIQSSDLNFVLGTFYTHNTEDFRITINGLMDGEEFIWMPDPLTRNAPVTIAGVTLAQSIEVINSYTITYNDSLGATSVQLEGSNNNLWSIGDGILIQNQTQVIPTNSAGLIKVTTGSAVLPTDIADIADAVWASISRTLTTGGGAITPQDIADIAGGVWSEDTSGHTTIGQFGTTVREIHGGIDRATHVNTENAANGDGYQQTPFNNWSDAVDYAEDNGLLTIEVAGSSIVDRQVKNFQIRGLGNPVIDLNGQDMKNTNIERCTITGSFIDKITVNECALVNLQNMSGVFLTVSIAGTITVANGADVIISRVAPAVAAQPWTLDMDNGGVSTVAVHNISGGLNVISMDHVDDITHLHFSQGEVTLDSTCILGTVVITGNVSVIDNSHANCNVTVVQPTNILTPNQNIPEQVRIEMDDNSTQLDVISTNTSIDIPTQIAALNDFDPAVDEVVNINVGAVTIDTAQLVDDIFNEDLSTHTVPNSFGEFVQKQLLTFKKFMGIYKKP